jgi:hypothetical protein
MIALTMKTMVGKFMPDDTVIRPKRQATFGMNCVKASQGVV